MSNPTIQLRLPTDALKAILGENPEALIEIEHRAAEKVAEELKRKLNSSTKAMINSEVNKATGAALDRARRSFQDRFRFPAEAKKHIESIVAAEMTKGLDRFSLAAEDRMKQIVARQGDLIKQEVTKHANAAMQASFDEMQERVEKLAREAFFDVLKEAKGGAA